MLVKAKPTNNCNTRNSNNLEVYEEKDFTCSELLDFIGKCRGEHHRDPLPIVRHVPTAEANQNELKLLGTESLVFKLLR